MRNRNFIILAMLFLSCFVGHSQSKPEKMKLRQSFIDSMHNQTREHIIIDTLSDYYNNFEYSQLNQQQKDLVFIRNFQDSLYSYDFVDLLANHSDLILERAFDVFKRINCHTTLAKIEQFSDVKKYFDPLFINGEIPEILNEDSPKFDQSEEKKIYKALFYVEEWISFLPREKVLSIYYYIIENKEYLYDEIGSSENNARIEKTQLLEKELNSKYIIGTWELSKIFDIAINNAQPVPESVIKNELLSDETKQITFFQDGTIILNNDEKGSYLLGVCTIDGNSYIQEILINGKFYSFVRHRDDELILKRLLSERSVYLNHRYEYEFKKIN